MNAYVLMTDEMRVVAVFDDRRECEGAAQQLNTGWRECGGKDDLYTVEQVHWNPKFATLLAQEVTEWKEVASHCQPTGKP